MRLVWILDARLAPPLCNQSLSSPRMASCSAIPDLLDVQSGTVGEYDGADHKDGERHRADVEREARYRDHGLEYFTVVGGTCERAEGRPAACTRLGRPSAVRAAGGIDDGR